MSIPASFMTATASGFSAPGSRPALWASKRSLQRWFIQASAIWLRALLWMQTKRTFSFPMVAPPMKILFCGPCRSALELLVKPGELRPVGVPDGRLVLAQGLDGDEVHDLVGGESRFVDGLESAFQHLLDPLPCLLVGEAEGLAQLQKLVELEPQVGGTHRRDDRIGLEFFLVHLGAVAQLFEKPGEVLFFLCCDPRAEGDGIVAFIDDGWGIGDHPDDPVETAQFLREGLDGKLRRQ